MSLSRPELAFASPRKLPKPRELKGQVVVLDVAFASEASGGGFDGITRPFIEGLGPRLAAWVDHHDHVLHASYSQDARFVLATKAQHGACPEMVTATLVAQIGPIDTIVCHTDFDGLCSAAKWIRKGVEPYPGSDDDARAVDTRMGVPSPTAQRLDRAIRARPRDKALLGLIVRHLTDGLEDKSLWGPIDGAASELGPQEAAAREIAQRYAILQASPSADMAALAGTGNAHSVALVDATKEHGTFDKTLLLMTGQERAPVALVVDGETLTLSARFDSGINFLSLLALSGGMPTLVSVNRDRMSEALAKLGVDDSDIARFVRQPV